MLRVENVEIVEGDNLGFEGVQITVSSRFEKLRTLQIKNHSYEEA